MVCSSFSLKKETTCDLAILFCPALFQIEYHKKGNYEYIILDSWIKPFNILYTSQITWKETLR